MLRAVQRWLLCSALCLTLLAPTSAAGQSVFVLLSEASAAYQEAAASLGAELERQGLARREIRQLTVAELAQAEELSPGRLVITLGTDAAEAMARRESRVPVLCALLPRQSFERIARTGGRRPGGQFSALYLDQPLGRQLDLLRLALPQARRVGVLLGEESRAQLPALEAAARPRELTLVSAQAGAGEPVFRALRQILDAADVLLALPDPHIYNPGSVQNILLATYRAKVPLLAFSPAYGRAGALLSLYATPAQIGRQAALMAQAVLQGRSLPQPQYPQEFSIHVNEHVARSLGLHLEAALLTERLRRLEKGP